MAVFVTVSAGIVAASWPSLRDRRSHGFPRFFAFEAIAALVAINLGAWFRDPFSIRQILSWALLLASLLLAIHGFALLRTIGRPSGGLETTTALVTAGAYRYIRHPLYASLLLLAWGAYVKDPSLAAIVLALAASGFLFATARIEEAENVQRFGAAYASYMRRSRMFVPWVL